MTYVTANTRDAAAADAGDGSTIQAVLSLYRLDIVPYDVIKQIMKCSIFHAVRLASVRFYRYSTIGTSLVLVVVPGRDRQCRVPTQTSDSTSLRNKYGCCLTKAQLRAHNQVTELIA